MLWAVLVKAGKSMTYFLLVSPNPNPNPNPNLTKAGKNMTYFLLMFLILILGFGLMGEQMLGTYLEGYSNIIRCTITRFTVLTLTLSLTLP